jgi:hypothetical protein
MPSWNELLSALENQQTDWLDKQLNSALSDIGEEQSWRRWGTPH